MLCMKCLWSLQIVDMLKTQHFVLRREAVPFLEVIDHLIFLIS